MSTATTRPPEEHKRFLDLHNSFKPDADDWLAMRVERITEKGTLLDFTFRDIARGGRTFRCVGASDHSDESLAEDDTGYWLAQEYHGQGIMAKALKMMLYRVSVIECGKRQVNLFVFKGNWASRRTLEKVGFVVQKDMAYSVVKYGKMVPQWGFHLYLKREDVERWKKETLEVTPLPSIVQ
ncbi:hypothetical protein EC957_005035 [Mortierella hygrophila]|uniref:N-acetyltransferase domain-containing protein n=1 Tax=Mortierella hygrophila TaxID=979708 RepID=A0A9P6FEE8_9FUNG|nr:hypothetical protein EC957_005035 [Mortierella hygrophila]